MDWVAWKPITTVCKTTNGNVLTQRTPIRLCNNLEGWEGWEVGGRFQTEGTICTSMANACCCMAEIKPIL